MNIIAKDKHLVSRVFGYGETESEAISECKLACREYLNRRLDITALYLYYAHNNRPVRPNGLHMTIMRGAERY